MTFISKKNETEAMAYLNKEKIYNEATNLNKMVAAHQKYPDYKIPLSAKEVANRLANQGFGYEKKYNNVNAEPSSRVSYDVFLQEFPEYKNDTVFEREFLKSLELDFDYRTNPVRRFDTFLKLFGDTLFAKQFVLNSESHDKYALLWCGLKLTDIINFFGEDDELFSQLITKRMDAASKSEIEKYLDQTKEYKVVEEYIYSDYEKTKNNPFRTWRSWLRNAKDLRPLLVGKIDLKRVDDCINNVESILEARAESWRKFNEEMCSNCEIDGRRTELPDFESGQYWTGGTYTIQNPGKIVMKNNNEYEFYYSDKGKWCLQNMFGFQTKEFNSGEEMMKYFLEECKRTYCR